MAKFSIWVTISLASTDVWAEKAAATSIWGVNIILMLAAMTPSLFGPKGVSLSNWLQIPMFIVTGWVMARWAAVVARRTTGSAPASDYFWPTVRALFNLSGLIVLVIIAITVLAVFTVHFFRHSHPAGIVRAIMLITPIIIALWACIRMSLLPYLVAIGEGLSFKRAWQISEGLATNLLGLALFSWLLAALSVGAFWSIFMLEWSLGLVQFPDLHDRAAIHDFIQSTDFRSAIMIGDAITAPVTAWVHLTIMGAYTRVALQLSAQASDPPALGIDRQTAR